MGIVRGINVRDYSGPGLEVVVRAVLVGPSFGLQDVVRFEWERYCGMSRSEDEVYEVRRGLWFHAAVYFREQLRSCEGFGGVSAVSELLNGMFEVRWDLDRLQEALVRLSCSCAGGGLGTKMMLAPYNEYVAERSRRYRVKGMHERYSLGRLLSVVDKCLEAGGCDENGLVSW